MPHAFPSPPDVLARTLDAAIPPTLRAWLAGMEPDEADFFARVNDAPDETRRQRALRHHLDHAVEWIEAEPTNTFTVGFADEGAEEEGDTRSRAFLVLTGSDGVKRAFYRSTGRSGGAYSGEWIPFHGFVNRGRTEELPWVWLVKEGKAKMPDPYDQPEAYRAYHLLRWADHAGLIEPGVTRIVPNYRKTLGNLKEAYEMLGEANRWLRHHGALANADRWRLPYPDSPPRDDFNQLFPLIGIDQHFPTPELRAWAKREGLSGAAVMRCEPVDALAFAPTIRGA